MVYRYYQTWDVPDSKNFDYVGFFARSKRQAKLKASKWLFYKESQCKTNQDIDNGYQGDLVAHSKTRYWIENGHKILNWEIGNERFNNYQAATKQN